jgi:polysaccharide biosynthesis protein PslH
MKRVLIVSPTPTHPPSAGNRCRILNFCTQLEQWGLQVHFLHVRMHGGDDAQMASYWAENYHYVPYEKPLRRERFMQKWLRRLRQTFDIDCRYRIGCDEWYIESIDKEIARLHKEHQFNIVIIEYVFLSRALLLFDRSTLKVIDTHNVFTDRHRLLISQGLKPYFFSTSPEDEKMALDRADVVIAIQDKEAKFFRAATNSKVITVGHLNSLTGHLTEPQGPGKTVLFLGASSTINAQGFLWFLENCIDKIMASAPAANIIVAGRVCSLLPSDTRFRSLGEVKNVAEVYRMADVVINPVLTGTGLNIKSAEALSHGLPLIATTSGSRGLEEGIGSAILVSDDPAEFSRHVVAVLTNPSEARRLRAGAIAYASQLQERNLKELKALIFEELPQTTLAGLGKNYHRSE